MTYKGHVSQHKSWLVSYKKNIQVPKAFVNQLSRWSSRNLAHSFIGSTESGVFLRRLRELNRPIDKPDAGHVTFTAFTAAHQSFRTSRSEEIRDKYNLVYHGALKSINKEAPNTIITFYVSKFGCWGFIHRCVISANWQFSFFWAGSSEYSPVHHISQN